MKLSIIANPEKYSVKAPFIEVLKWADSHEVEVFIDERLETLREDADQSSATTKTSEQEAVAKGDVIISIGGDGTMLYAARLMRTVDKPVLGVNSGRLGFLANTQQERLAAALNFLIEENYDVKKRHLLQAEGKEEKYFALNEFLFSKKDSTSMITVNASYDDMFINKYWADGLIVASPTGSTAYNLSSDGPIVTPNSNVMALTPINPHTLTTRPVILPSNKPLTVTVEKQQHDVLFSFDGNSREIDNYPFEVSIQQSDYAINLIELPGQNYFETLRHKLMWGMDFRKR